MLLKEQQQKLHAQHLQQHEDQVRQAQAQHQQHVDQFHDHNQREPKIMKRYIEPKLVDPNSIDETMYDTEDEEEAEEEKKKEL